MKEKDDLDTLVKEMDFLVSTDQSLGDNMDANLREYSHNHTGLNINLIKSAVEYVQRYAAAVQLFGSMDETRRAPQGPQLQLLSYSCENITDRLKRVAVAVKDDIISQSKTLNLHVSNATGKYDEKIDTYIKKIELFDNVHDLLKNRLSAQDYYIRSDQLRNIHTLHRSLRAYTNRNKGDRNG